MKAHLAPDSSAVTATADTSNRSISTSAYFPSVVRIKRKRDEPVLPGFVLSSKRPSLANLSLGGNDEYESQQPLAQPQEQQSRGATRRPRAKSPRAFVLRAPCLQARAAAQTAAAPPPAPL